MRSTGEGDMPIGPGRYDDVTTLVRELTGAACVLVVVVGGRHGDGFDAQVDAGRVSSVRGVLQLQLDALRMAADMLERDLKAGVVDD